MFEIIVFVAVAVIISVNVLTTVSPKFRRWIYSR
jgi:hypothetical protein